MTVRRPCAHPLARFSGSALGLCCVFAWFVIGCDSPGHDDQDALDDTIGIVDTVIAVSQDITLHSDADPDGTAPLNLLAGGATVALSQLADAIAQWECQRIVSCGCTTAKQPKPDVASCAALLSPAIAKAWSNGGLVARADLIPVCVAALDADSAPCSAAKLTGVTPCLAALRWPGKSGDACGGNGPFLCADGGDCEAGTCTGNPLGLIALGKPCANPFVCGNAECVTDANGKGVCQAPVPVGQPCANVGDCVQPAVCRIGVCTLPAKAGGKCSAITDCGPGLDCVGGSCAVPASCSPGSACGNGGECLGEIMNSCKALKPAGGTCAASSECAGTAYCDGASQTCTALPGLGGVCGNGVFCGAGLGCESGKTTCQALPGAGQKCLLGPGGPFLCAAGLACSGTTMTCDTPPLENAPCAADNSCSDADIDGDGKKGDLACNVTFKGKVCSKKLAAGTQCQNEACQDGLFCDTAAGKCAAKLGAGSPCTASTACSAGAACTPNASGKLSCGPLPSSGGLCLTDCASGLFCAIGPQSASCQPPVCADLDALQ